MSERYGPAEMATGVLPGDFILTHERGWQADLIRFGQGLHFLGRNRRHARWSHAALIVSPAGDLIEAVGGGVRRAHLEDYRDIEYHLIRLEGAADDRDRAQMVRFAESALGRPYGLLTIVSVAISLLSNGGVTFGVDGTYICSGLVARALERTDIILPRTPSHMMPGDLARLFRVPAPPRGTPRRA